MIFSFDAWEKSYGKKKRENSDLIYVDFSSINIRHSDSCLVTFERAKIPPKCYEAGF